MRFLSILPLAGMVTLAPAANVLPTIGGDQVTMMGGAPMKHAAIDFDGASLSVHVDSVVATPLLRELSAPNAFDPSERWAVLSGKSYNFQYGWLPQSAWAPPSGLAVYVEQLEATPGLEVYEGGTFRNESTVRAMTFSPLFEAQSAWRWPGVMVHNAYAVASPTLTSYEATYRVFLGDALTGVEPTDALGARLYGDDTVTLSWAATPVPEGATASLAALSLLALAVCRR